MLRRFPIQFVLTVLVLSGSGTAAVAQGWTYTVNVQHSGPGPCIPYPPMPSINYYTKDACEYNRQSELDKNGEDWSLYGDGSCILIITATPCVGSDIGPGAGGSGGSSMAGDPGNVSITGLLTGNAMFSPHDTRDIENWINEFMQRNRAYGIPVEGMNPITSSDVPLTGNADFNRFYTEQMIRFEKPEQGGTVYLKEGQTTIDPNYFKKTSGSSGDANYSSVTPEMQYGKKFSDKAELFEDLKGGAMDENTDLEPYIEFGRNAGVFGVGLLKKGAIPAIVIVDVLAEDIKMGVQLYKNAYMGENEPIPGTGEILWNTAENIATDVAGAYIGDKAGKVVAAATIKHAEEVMVKKGVLWGIAKISEKPKQIGEATSTGLGVMTGGLDLVDAWSDLKQSTNNPGK